MNRTRIVLDQVDDGIVLCRYCGARIVWALTNRDRPTPVDVQPVRDGCWVLYHYAEEEPVPRQRVSYAPLNGYGSLYRGPRWRSHWSTCPQRDVAKRDHLAELAGTRPTPQLNLFGKGGL
jgi:hypothetical protein